jgi:hypothetical protein
MKSIFAALTLALIVLFSGISAIFGIGIMAYDLYSGGDEFMRGFTIFCMGATLFFAATVAFIVTKILTNTDVIATSMVKFFEHEIEKEETKINPMQAFFGRMGLPEMGNGSIKIATLDEDGNITPVGEKTFTSHEEMIKHRDELLANAFGYKPEKAKTKFEDMTLAELESEEKKAVDGQQFELAAAIRDLMNEKKNKKD